MICLRDLSPMKNIHRQYRDGQKTTTTATTTENVQFKKMTEETQFLLKPIIQELHKNN